MHVKFCRDTWLKRHESYVYSLFHKVVQLLLYRPLSLIEQDLKQERRRSSGSGVNLSKPSGVGYMKEKCLLTS